MFCKGDLTEYQYTIEVDFIAINHLGKQTLVQVSALLDNKTTLQREVRALTEASIELPNADLLLITMDTHQTIQIEDNKTIQILPAWQWLL